MLFLLSCASKNDLVYDDEDNGEQSQTHGEENNVDAESAKILLSEVHPEFDTAQQLNSFLQFQSPFTEKELATYLYSLLKDFPSQYPYTPAEKQVLERFYKEAKLTFKAAPTMRATFVKGISENPRVMHWVFYFAVKIFIDQKLSKLKDEIIFKKEEAFVKIFKLMLEFAESFLETYNNAKYYEFLRKKYVTSSVSVLNREVKVDPERKDFLMRSKLVKPLNWDSEELNQVDSANTSPTSEIEKAIENSIPVTTTPALSTTATTIATSSATAATTSVTTTAPQTETATSMLTSTQSSTATSTETTPPSSADGDQQRVKGVNYDLLNSEEKPNEPNLSGLEKALEESSTTTSTSTEAGVSIATDSANEASTATSVDGGNASASSSETATSDTTSTNTGTSTQ